MTERAMRRFGIACLAGVLLFGFGANLALGENSVVINDQFLVEQGATIDIPIFLTNDVSLRGVVLPLVIREETGDLAGGTISSVGMTFGDRLPDEPGAPISDIKFRNQYADEDGACKSGQPGGFGTIAHNDGGPNPVAALPEGVMFVRQTILASPQLPPGSDTEGSFVLTVTVGTQDGCFYVDTTCANPANHLLLSDALSLPVPTDFTPGQICIGITGVKEIGATTAGVPDEYKLSQNYPNPFNAGTVIEFTNKVNGHVAIEVYNILGQNVVTLLDEHLDAGVYAVDWDGRDSRGNTVPSGMYFYRVQAGDFSAVKKMVVLK